jgi:hypothetical protein
VPILRGGWKNGRLSATKIPAFELVGRAGVNCCGRKNRHNLSEQNPLFVFKMLHF